MTNEERIQLTTEFRMIEVAMPVLGPILAQRRNSALGKILAAHASGADLHGPVAEFAIIEGLIRDITTKQETINYQLSQENEQ